MTETAEIQTQESVSRGELNTPEFSVPEAYQDRGWAQNIKSQDDLYNQFDNLNKLIGKKTIPNNDASDEEWNEFYSKVRPESADQYDLKYPEGVEVDLENPEVKAELDFVRGMMHKAGLSQRQADALFKDYVSYEMGKAPTPEQLEEQKAAQEKEFDEKMKESFGSKASDALKTSSRAMAALSESERSALSELPNDQLISVIKLLNKAQDGKKEDMMPSGDGAGNSSQSIEQIRKELAEARTSKAYRDFTDPNHAEAKKKVEELSARVQKHYS